MLKQKAFSIKTKMFFIFAGAYISLVSIIGFAIYISNYNEMKSQTSSLTQVLTTQFTRTIDLYFEDMERLSLIVYTDFLIQESLGYYEKNTSVYNDLLIKNDLYPRLFNQIYPRKDIESISIYTNTGAYFKYEKQGDIEVHHNSELTDWQKRLDNLPKRDFLFIPTHEVTSRGGEKVNVVSLVRNIYMIPNRHKVGSMKIDINIDIFKRLLDLENVNDLEQHARLFVLTGDKQVIFDDQEMLTGKKSLNLNFPHSMNHYTSDTITWENNQYLYSVQHSDYTGWDISMLIDDDFIIYERNQIIAFVVISGLIAIAIIALVSYYLSHHLSKPLVKMMRKMKKVEEGHLSERMDFTGSPEMDLLTRVYNSMLDSINKLITEVYELSITEKNAKISALQSQINPHFLYNTLNVMKSISRLKGVDEVADISESLSDLFKYSMKDLDKTVPLMDEVEHITNYMNIQKHRFGDRYQYYSSFQEEALKVYVPKLIIQPLIENSIKHGLERRGYGIISLTAKIEKDNLIVSVEDNGVGMNEQTLHNLRLQQTADQLIENKDGGIGLTNIQQRVRLMYGFDYGLDIQSECEKGTKITLKLPVRTNLFEEGVNEFGYIRR
jgi:two-component system, sensor histidine kinase YesM